MIPSPHAFAQLKYCILHVCGGDPVMENLKPASKLYSPRVWRWSYHVQLQSHRRHVFSTCVEVIPKSSGLVSAILCILHVCGGDPKKKPPKNFWSLYSPRVWRWSPSQNIVKQLHPVFSTYVEVILFPHTLHSADLSILHVCGGDPISSSSYKNINMYSPRMWRYCYIGIPEEIMNVIIRDHKEKF